jgi:hypothetical protein
MDFFSVTLGGLIAGVASWIATNRTYNHNLLIQERARKISTYGLIQALYDEITILWERYMWGVGKALEGLDDRKGITWIYPVTQENFVIYNQSASLIGLIDDDDLRSMIVKTYTKARSLIDAYRLNNEYVKQMTYLDILQRQYKLPDIGLQLSQIEHDLVYYAKKIKAIHDEIKDDIEILSRLFRIKLLSMKIEKIEEPQNKCLWGALRKGVNKESKKIDVSPGEVKL